MKCTELDLGKIPETTECYIPKIKDNTVTVTSENFIPDSVIYNSGIMQISGRMKMEERLAIFYGEKWINCMIEVDDNEENRKMLEQWMSETS